VWANKFCMKRGEMGLCRIKGGSIVGRSEVCGEVDGMAMMSSLQFYTHTSRQVLYVLSLTSNSLRIDLVVVTIPFTFC
jgi:hypothetical protein